jgi:putative transposase
VRNPAIVQAYATGCYSMKEIAEAFDVHYATVSRVLKKVIKMYDCKT